MTLTSVIILAIKIFFVLNFFLIGAAYVVLLERKVSAWIQNRVGPNRVGWGGSLQSFSDVLKLVMKEDIVPAAAHKRFHLLAPIIAIGVALAAWMIVPFAAPFTIGDKLIVPTVAPDLNIGLLLLL